MVAIIVVCTVVVFGALIDGFVICKLWAWFITGTFQTPPISLGFAMGLGLLVRYLTQQDFDVETKDRTAYESLVRLFGQIVARPLITLAIAFVVTLFL